MAFRKENCTEVGALVGFISAPPLSKHQNPLEGLLKQRVLGPKVSDSVDLRWVPRICIFNESHVILILLSQDHTWRTTALGYLCGEGWLWDHTCVRSSERLGTSRAGLPSTLSAFNSVSVSCIGVLNVEILMVNASSICLIVSLPSLELESASIDGFSSSFKEMQDDNFMSDSC